MANAIVQVVDGRAVVQFSGPEAIASMLAQAGSAAGGASADAARAEVAREAAEQAASEATGNPADWVFPESFGAVGDGVFASAERAAFIDAHNAAVTSGRPLVLTGRYNIGEDLYYSPAVTYMGAGSDPRILGAFVPNKDSRNRGTTVGVDFKFGSLRRSETLAPSYRRPFAEKSLWLGKGDQRRIARKALDVGSGHQVICDFPSSISWTVGSYGSAVATGIGFSLTTGLRWTGIVWPVHGGMELSASVKADQPNVNRGVLVLCTKGYFVFWADAAGVGNYGYKYYTGDAGFESTNIEWGGRTTHASWTAANVDWTVRLCDHRTIGVLLNGVEVFRYTLPEGEIDCAGFMGMKTSTDAGLSVEFPSAARLSEPQGGQVVRLAAFGDSKTDGYFGSWTDAFREALDGSAGIRVTQIVNRAVSGQNSLAQLGVMQANPPAGMTDVVIHVGTNDVQGGADASVTLNNISAMIDLCVSSGVSVGRVHVVVPDLWYDQAEAGGFGEDTSAYETGERTRMAILKLGSDRGCKVVNLAQVLGPVLGSQITSPDISDPRVRDNIHPTSFAYRVIGMEIAKSVLNGAAPAMLRAVSDRAVAGAWANGWAAGGDAPVYRVSEEGVLSMGGFITPGTKAEGTMILTLPRSLWPRTTARIPLWGGTGVAAVEISAGDGTMKIYGAASVSYLALDAISFAVRSLF